MPTNSFNLANLIAPVRTDEFLKNNWPDKYAVFHHDPAWLENFPEVLGALTPAEIFRDWPGSLVVYPADERAQVSSLEVNLKQGERLYRAGMGLSLGGGERFIPALSHGLRDLGRELGLPKDHSQSRCIVYLARKGGGTSTHFDQNINFTIQLRGRKRWRIAANRNVVNPTARHDLAAKEIHPDLKSYMTGEFPTRMPADADSFVMEPGSVLFLPRAVWHDTEVLEDALSLNFTFSQPTWAELALQQIQRHLIKNEEWRALARDSGAAGTERRAEAKRRFADLLSGLWKELEKIPVDDFFFSWSPAFRMVPGLMIDISERSVSIRDQATVRLEVSGKPELHPLFHWLLERRDGFTANDASVDCSLPATTIADFFEVLVNAKVLQRI